MFLEALKAVLQHPGLEWVGSLHEDVEPLQELEAAQRIFQQGLFTVVDVTDKPIETSADEIIPSPSVNSAPGPASSVVIDDIYFCRRSAKINVAKQAGLRTAAHRRGSRAITRGTTRLPSSTISK